MRLFAFVATAIFITGWAANASKSDRAVSILQETKTAMGGEAWNKIQIWHERGTARSPDGVSSEYDSYYDFVRHRFHDTRLENGSKKLAIFDGNEFLFFTNSKLDHTDASSEMNKIGLQGAYMNTYGFFFVDRFPATIRFKGAQREGNSIFDIVEVTPNNLSAMISGSTNVRT
jgi:hypothetical protein